MERKIWPISVTKCTFKNDIFIQHGKFSKQLITLASSVKKTSKSVEDVIQAHTLTTILHLGFLSFRAQQTENSQNFCFTLFLDLGPIQPKISGLITYS